MATIVLRAGKGSPLTNAEVDANFTNLNTAVVDAAVTASWASVSGKPATLAGYGITDAQALDADLTAIAALAGTTGFLKKTAANTWALDTATYLTGNQSISYTGDATGSGTTSVALTLANSGVTAGTYPKVTVDAKGRVTAGAALVAGDVPTLNQSTTGNAATATVLQTARTINGVSFNGSANVTVTTAGTGVGVSGTAVSIAAAYSPDTSTELATAVDLNTLQTAGFYYQTANADAAAGFNYPIAQAGSLFIQKSAGVTQQYQTYGTTDTELHFRSFYNTVWGGWRRVLTSSNYNNFSPTLLGTGASGTWGINVTGNAATASTLNSGAVISGSAYFRKNQTAGDYTTAPLWIESYGNTSTGIAFHISGVAGRYLEMRNNSSNLFWNGNAILNDSNYNSYSPTLTGTGASGTWGINVTGSSASVSGLTLTSSANGINPDSVTQNQLGYITSVGLFGQTDGGLYSSAYDNTWIHQIFGDFRTGQLAVRGKNSGTWQSWRAVLDSSNYNSYAPTLTGTGASGTWGISVTGNAATAYGLNVHTARNNEANKVVRTDGSGYIQAGWINTTSGDNGTAAIDRIYASNDAYLRYYTPANFRTVLDVPTRGGTGASGTWGISVTGSAATLTTGRTLAMTGDVTYTSASFNGSANVTGTATLANSGVTAGTYTKVTVDTKGRVTFGATLLSTDLPTYTGSITSEQVTNALTFTPYNATNPNGYITSTASITGNAATSTRSVVEDTRAAQRTPAEYAIRATSYEFTNQFTGLTGWKSGITTKGWTSGYAAWQIIGPADSAVDENFYLRSGLNTTWNTVRTILHSGNYNNYSPTLTGAGASGSWGISVTGSAASITGTYGGSLTSSQITTGLGFTPYNSTNPSGYITSSGSITGTAAGLSGTPNLGFSASGQSVGYAAQGGPQVQSQGNGAAMISFHRPGAYGINFGLNSDNVLCTGGWSRGGTHVVVDTGNIGNYAVLPTGSVMSGNLSIRNGSPTLYLQDTDNTSAMLHCNGSKVYILRGSGADSTIWTALNGEWPVYWDLNTNATRFGGAVHAVGTITTNYGFNSDSDERIKGNWTALSNDFVERLAIVKCGTYDRIDIKIGKRQIGVSAQSLQALMPEAVGYNEEEDRYSVNYGNAALSSAVELAKRVVMQSTEIDDLKTRIVKLEFLISKLIGDDR